MVRRFLSIALIGALAACGGGSHSLLPGGNGSTAQSGTLKVTLNIPEPTSSKAVARGRKYISYSSNGASLTYVAHGSAFTQPSAGTSSAANATTDISEASGTGVGKACTNTTSPARTCTLTIPNFAPGEYDMELVLWDTVPTNATTPAGNILSRSAVVTQAVLSGQSNTLGFTFSGVVHDIVLNLATSQIDYSTSAASANMYIVLKDQSGNVLVNDGTGAALVGSTGAVLTGSIAATNTAPNTLTNCPGAAAGAATKINGAASPYTFSTIPSASVPVNYQGGCVVSVALASSVSGDTIAGTAGTTALTIGGITQEFGLTGISAGGTGATIVGSDGKVYTYAQTGAGPNYSIYVVDPVTGAQVTSVAIPSDISATVCPHSLANGSDGNVWYTLGCNAAGGGLGWITTGASHTVGDCKSPQLPAGDAPEGLTTGNDGKLWIADRFNGALVSFTPSRVTCNAGASLGFGGPNYIVPSPVAPTVSATAGGTVANGTYLVEVTYVNTSGETRVSPEATQIIVNPSANQTITVTSPAAQLGATQYKVYMTLAGGASGTETLQGAATNIGTNFVQSTTPVAGASQPTLNTAANPYKITSGPDGNLWVTDTPTGAGVTAIDAMSTGGVTQQINATTGSVIPQFITTLDGTHLVYSTTSAANQVVFISTAGNVQVAHAINTGGGYALPNPAQLVVGADGNIYYPELHAGAPASSAIGQMSSAGALLSDFPMGFATDADSPQTLATDLSGGNIWVGTSGAAHIAKFVRP